MKTKSINLSEKFLGGTLYTWMYYNLVLVHATFDNLFYEFSYDEIVEIHRLIRVNRTYNPSGNKYVVDLEEWMKETFNSQTGVV